MRTIERMKGLIQQRLDSLSPKARLRLVVSVFAAFAVCCVYQFVTAVINFGTGKAEVEMRHIESVSLFNDSGQGVDNLLKLIEEWKKKK